MDDIDWKARAQAAEQALSELKGEVLEKVGPFADEFGSDIPRPDDWQVFGNLTLGHFRALSSLHEKLSSIGGSSSTETAASLADGKLTAGEAQRKSDWRTIDSAPRDGTQILVANDLGGVFDAWWENGGWIDGDTDTWGEPTTYHPTHWQPLPPPPNPSARGEL